MRFMKAYKRTVECFKLLNRSQFVTSSFISSLDILTKDRYSDYNTCIMVWPTAFSVLASMPSMVSAIVCQRGPNELCGQSG